MAIKLHTYLKEDEYCNYKEIISYLGKSSSGLIMRDFIVPSDMPLWALHYALEKAYGFQNAHLHSFHLLNEDFIKINKNNTGEWRKHIGVLFKSPTRCEEEDYWADDYTSGSFNNWRKKKYTGPYRYKGFYFTPKDWQDDFNEFLNRFGPSFVLGTTQSGHGFEVIRPLKEYNHDLVNEHIYKFDDIPLDKINRLFEYDYKDLLETITVSALAKICSSFIYEYDFGDGWEIIIEISNEIDQKEEAYVEEHHKPLMVSYDGLNLIDDVGGISGFCRFLYTIYNLKEVRENQSWSYEIGGRYYVPIKTFEGFDYYPDLNPDATLGWAKYQEWSEKLPQLDKWF